jgi:mono/diheme cytochrome c family protein
VTYPLRIPLKIPLIILAKILAILVYCCALEISLSSKAYAENWNTIDGKVLYQKFCSSCHGEIGKSPENLSAILESNPTDLNSNNYKYGNSREEIIKSIKEGRGENMLQFKNILSDKQIEAIADYIKKL